MVTAKGAPSPTRRVHRLAYILIHGDPGLDVKIDHECHNRSGCKEGERCHHRRCWNPEHLQATTDLENKRNAGKQGWALHTHCINDHLYDENNTYWTPSGTRACKACHKDRNRIYAERKRREAGVPELGRRVSYGS